MPHVRPYSRAVPKTLLIIAVLALAARAQTVLPDTAAADRLKGTVESFSDFLLKYFVALAAVGALSMALIELWKKIRDSQTRFHARVLTEWFQEYSSPGAFAELLHLATGMDPESAQKAAGDLFGKKGSLPHWYGQSWMQSDALFALDLDRMMGHIQNAADLTLNLPSLYPRLYAVITDGSRPGDAEAWKSMADAPAREDISAAESKQRADLYARLHQVAKTKLDALQLYAGREWVNWNQRWANIVGVAVMLGCLLWLAKHEQVVASPLAIIVLSAFGGILSPVAKDIVIALKRSGMGRYHGLPGDYHPALRLQLRKEPEGGGVRNPGVPLPQMGPALSRREILVMIHGFNNHEGEAAEEYIGFRVCQYANFGELPPGSLDKILGDGFWPGDADFWGWLDLGDFFVYPRAVAKAKDAAAALEKLLLAKLPNLERVNFIAHSLGCRVVLETAKRLIDRGHPALGRICLMAAAVPVEMLAPRGRFGSTLRRMQALGVRIHVLHSVDDDVLKYTFVPGQAAAGPSESTLLALGRHGPPRDMPGRGDNVTDRQVPGAGHSNYWGHKLNQAALLATREAGNFFGFGTPRRTIESRSIGARTLS